MKKALSILGCGVGAITVMLGSPVSAQTSTQNSAPMKISIIDHHADQLITKFKGRKFDSRSTELNAKAVLDSASNVSAGNTIAANFNDLVNDPTQLAQVKQYISEGYKVYVYGDVLKISNVDKLLGTKIDKLVGGNSSNQLDNETWQFLSYQNQSGFKPAFGKIQLIDKNGQEVSPSNAAETFIQSILNNEDLASGNNSKITPYDFSSDPIVNSKYNINSTNYDYDSSNNWVQTATLNDYWILHKDNSSTDPNYQYFFVQDSIQENVWNGAKAFELVTQHNPPGNTLQWSPSSSTGSTWSVSLPWSVSWSFNTSDTVTASVSGVQGSSGNGRWELTAPWYYPSGFFATGVQYQPGTAFAFNKSGYGPYYVNFPLYHKFTIYWGPYNQYIDVRDDATVNYTF